MLTIRMDAPNPATGRRCVTCRLTLKDEAADARRVLVDDETARLAGYHAVAAPLDGAHQGDLVGDLSRHDRRYDHGGRRHLLARDNGRRARGGQHHGPPRQPLPRRRRCF